MQSEDDSLWESFPQALETLEGVRRYISAFRALLQELNNLNSKIRCMPCGPARCWPYLLSWRGCLLQEASQRISQSLTCWVGLPWSKTWQQPAGGTTQPEPGCGPPCDGPTSATGSNCWSGLLSLLLLSKPTV